MGYISSEQVAEKRKKLKEAFPDYKFSIVKDGYSGIRVTILEGTIPLLKEGETYKSVNVYYIDRSFDDMPQAKDVINRIYSILNEGNKSRETSDYGMQPDFYVYINIGDYEKPYKVIPKKSSQRATKKSFSKGSFKKESKTEGFEFLQTCSNGWNLYFKENQGSPKPYQYRLVKDYDVKPVDKDKFYALKGEMLEVGFSWNVKAQCFEMFKFDEITQDEVDSACDVLFNYFPFKEQSKEPTKEKENIPEEKKSDSIPSDDKGSESTEKVPIESIYLVWDDKRFDSFGEFENYIKNILYEGDESNIPNEGYDKYKVEFKWKDGSYILDRIDISKNKGDFNPFSESLNDYYQREISIGNVTIYYDYDYITDISKLSFEDLQENQSNSNEEVDIVQHLNDVSILLEMETDSVKRAELEQYISDLQILASLNN